MLVCASLFAQRTTVLYKGVNFKCKISKNSAVVTSFDVDADSVVVPGMIEYKRKVYPVKEVSTHLNGNSYLARVLVLEEGIEKIDNFSFVEFRKLREVYLPSTIRNIGQNGFRKNKGMVFHLPGNLIHSRLWNWGQTELCMQPFVNDMAENVSKKTENEKTSVSYANSDNDVSWNEKYNCKHGNASQSANNLFPVDSDIPTGKEKNSHTYCVVIANENYEEAPKVDCAINDGTVFAEYCRKTLGIPANQIRTYLDAGYTDVLRGVRFLEDVQKFDKEAKLIFYYSGHGIPNDADRTAYILPVDGSPKEIQTCVGLKNLYQRLGNIQAKSVTVLLDACFSGTSKGSSDGVIAARSIVRVKQENATGNVVVISAASGDETAFALKEANHGLFTYSLLKQLKSSKGKMTLGDLFREIKQEVAKSSVLDNGKLQTPTVTCSPALKGKWEDFYF